MKTNKNITIDIDLLNKVQDKIKPPQTFSALVSELLAKWESRKAVKD